MKHLLFLSMLLLFVATTTTKADLLDCTEEKFVALPDLSGIGPKVADDSSGEHHEVRDFLKSVGCQIKKGASKVKEQAKKIGTEIKIGARKLGEKAKVLGADLKTKFDDFKERLSNDSGEELPPRRLLANVEIINPDILKAEQQCGHGHILDALEIKIGARKLGEKAKVLGADLKTKFDDFKERLSNDSDEERPPRRLLANVEIINPDILKAEQQCGHGHILDALGNCSKLRK